MKAKFPGYCPNCKKRFTVNKIEPDFSDEITKDAKSGKWVHQDCNVAKQYADRQQELVGKSYATRNQPIEVDTDALTEAIEMIDGEVVDQPQEKFTYTSNQIAVFEYISTLVQQMLSGALILGHLVIEAVAGSGKSFTIKRSLSLIPRSLSVCFLAFNAHIVKALKRDVPDYVHVSTLHSLGLLNIRNYNGKHPKIDNDKVGMILDTIWPVSKAALELGAITKQSRKENFAKRLSMRTLVSISKSTLVDPFDGNAVMQMIERYNVEMDDQYIDELVNQLPNVLEQCQKNTEVIDFDDMLWLPIILNMQLLQFDFLMVDEAQDMNACQIQFILRSIKETGRIIAVGDRKQSLYAFRGADSNAIPNIIEKLSATVLPLSITFRCPTSHVELAKRLVPQIEARENAPLGQVIRLEYFNMVSQLEVNDMVVCRTNGPLIRPAFECIRRGKKAVIRGKDIGSSLIELIKRFGVDDLAGFDVSLGEYYEHEYTKLMDKGKEMQALLLQDKVETLRFIMNEVSTISELMNKIMMLFDDGQAGIVFSSVHRAKGLEANNVFILRPDLMPHPRAKKDYEMEQEMNCLYVAITRSKDILFFVKGDENGVQKGELSPILQEVNNE